MQNAARGAGAGEARAKSGRGMSLPHRIRRLRFRVRARSKADAFTLRARFRAELDQTLQPALSRIFDELAPGNEVLHLPRLEIHARVTSLEELADVLPDLVRRELGDRLRTPAPSGPSASTGLVRRTSVERSRLEALLHYLETGSLPWSDATWVRPADAARPDPLPLEEALAAASALRAAAPFDRPALSRWFRLLQLVAEDAWGSLARALALPPAPPAPRATAPARGTPPPPPREDGDDLAQAVAALAAASAFLSRHARLTLAAAAITSVRAGADRAASGALFLAIVAEALGGTRPVPALVAVLPEEARPLFTRLLPEPDPTPPPDRTAASSSPAAPGPAETQRALAPSGARAPAPEPAAREPDALVRAILGPPPDHAAEQPFGVLVASAGLVLLHPYLARFFGAAGIERPARGAIPPASLPRAAALLLYLATGEDEAPEHELAFIRILLGLAPAEPLPIGAGLLGPADRDEAEALLQAVIGHWGALGGTSPAGLRASFLARPGLVREDENGFRLQVEPASFDVLLRALPWGISIVRLPWMTKPIFAEWPTP